MEDASDDVFDERGTDAVVEVLDDVTAFWE
jgi:hypothetical protein